MDISVSQSSSLSNSKVLRNHSKTIVCLQQNICLPSNLLQKKKNILHQFRLLKSQKESRIMTSREPTTLMSKTFCHSQNVRRKQDDKVQVLIEQKIQRKKDGSVKKKPKNPLYRRLSDIQSENKQLAGVSFSKLLSRMLVLDNNSQDQKKQFSDYKKKKHPSIEFKNKSISAYQCLESKLFTIQCPQIKYQSARTSPSKTVLQSSLKAKQPHTNRLFKRYFNPHGQKTDKMSEYQSIQFDERYIYRNGKKSQCKRIHNFYTSQMFKKNYQKHMRNTIDTFYSTQKVKD